MKRAHWLLTALLLSTGLVSACASTEVVDHDPYAGPRLERPARVLVYDFAATREDLPAWSAARSALQAGPEPSDELREAGRELGEHVARSLVSEIEGMGLKAERATATNQPVDGDLILVGYFSTFDEGSRLERMVIGFGTGAAELQTRVEAYGRTEGRYEQFASGGLRDGGSAKGPGMVLPVAITIATANPIGLVVGGAIKATGEITGQSTIEAAGKRAAEKISEALEKGFRRQGWI